jgi:hypothetical protein
MLLNTADHVYLGTTPVDAVYLGTTKVWPQATLPPGVEIGHGWDKRDYNVAGGSSIVPYSLYSYTKFNHVDMTGADVGAELTALPVGTKVHILLEPSGRVMDLVLRQQPVLYSGSVSFLADYSPWIHDPPNDPDSNNYGVAYKTCRVFVEKPTQGLTAVLEAGGVLRIDGQFTQGDHTLTITDPNGVGATLADTQTMSVTGSIIPADAASGMVLLSPNHWSNYKTHIGTPLHAVGHRQVLGTMVMYTESVTTT